MACQLDTATTELGFLENAASWKLTSKYFPSKLGGKPAWLALKNLPDSSTLECKSCGKPSVFLLQIYAPIEEKEECFHRTLFVFVCKDASCYKQNTCNNNSVIALRSQLPRKNDFYSSVPPNLDIPPETTNDDAVSTCVVCGCVGTKSCSACHKVKYCGKDHQILDWKAGHKQACKKLNNCDEKLVNSSPASEKLLFPELEIVIEPEDYPATDIRDQMQMPNDEEMRNYEKWISAEAPQLQNDSDVDVDLNDMAFSEKMIDKQFLSFKKRIEHNPDQVLRYDKGGEPLWVTGAVEAKSSHVPVCDCGAERQFEFQILPQLLCHLGLGTDNITTDSIDWGTLAVYTCKDSCSLPGKSYYTEFIWKQDYL